MSAFDMAQYFSIFLEEADEQLQILNENLVTLERDRQNKELLNQIFRAAHTLKGSSASMGFEKLASLTHEMEGILEQFRSGELGVGQRAIDVLLECLDTLQSLKAEVIEEKDEIDISGLVERIRELEKGDTADAVNRLENGQSKTIEKDEVDLESVEANAIRKAMENGYKSYLISVDLDPECLMKSVRAFIVFNNLSGLGEIIKTIPRSEEIEEELFDSRFGMVFVSREGPEKIRGKIESVSEVAAVHVDLFPSPEDLQGINGCSPAAEKTGQPKEPEKVEKGNVAQTVRVNVGRLDSLMNLVGELVIERTRLEAVGQEIKSSAKTIDLMESLEEISVHIARLSRELQEEIMQARMFPIDQVFNRFPRMVRDLALKSNKQVRLVIEGRETELDRTVIEEIGDPLIHMLRNAVDHGIESPQERVSAGKPAEGTVLLKAAHLENQIVITVEDDGRGIDPEDIKRRCIEKEIITKETAAKMSDVDATYLIFTPGFSTAENVSDVSGRGVGMDIVKSHIEKINGHVEISTEKNKGTKFTVKLPLTLAINRALLVKNGGRVYAVPLSNVVEIIDVDPQDIQTMRGRGRVALVRDSFVPLFELGALLDFHSEPPQSKVPVVIVSFSEKRIGIIVERLMGEQEIVIKSLGGFIGDIPGVAGATIMGDGSVALILDVRGLVASTGVE